ncbi:hypothetical protein NB636_07910 [Oxalobacter aliiformigenes]|uniref:hypothetical protein n=1 Tax=Oxalobacter aliiformigenes TaxID=2946593 RepID=UPI0022B00472|nr:hypothetical protein [Oxalobacter aliiformigenes]MCZ4065736.1 hypothetical protein [Oxalobacter aliiformigenes]WAV98632.1 hypothetical protein NB636_07910 [Oxalobacter aliiformigenes]
MTALPEISKFIDSSITEGDFKVALSEMRNYLDGLLGEDGTTETARTILKIPLSGVVTQADSYTATASDSGKIIRFTGSSAITLTLSAALSLGTGWNVTVINDTSSAVTIATSAGEAIDGTTSYVIKAGGRAQIVCDGTRFFVTSTPSQDSGTHGWQLFTGNGTFTVPEGVERIYVVIASGSGGGTGARIW